MYSGKKKKSKVVLSAVLKSSVRNTLPNAVLI
jgi:hypothetical protein